MEAGRPKINSKFLNTYDSARGFTLGGLLGTSSDSESELSRRVTFPLLGASPFGSLEVILFFFLPLRGELLSSSSSSYSSSSSPSWDERASFSPDTMSEGPLWRGPPLASLPFFSLAFFSGA